MQSIRRIGTTEATILTVGASRRAAELGIPMCIAIADESGNLVSFVREDGAKFTSIAIAIAKAFTAAGARNHTAFYAEASKPGGPAWGIDGSNGGRFTVIPGGSPVIEGNNVVGAIGISGGNSSQDHDVALAALEALNAEIADLTTIS